MTNHDLRQYRHMAERLAQFDSEEIGLGPLIADLEALLEALEEPDLSWKARVRTQWEILEEIYAVAREQRMRELPVDYSERVRTAAGRIGALVAGELSKDTS